MADYSYVMEQGLAGLIAALNAQTAAINALVESNAMLIQYLVDEEDDNPLATLSD